LSASDAGDEDSEEGGRAPIGRLPNSTLLESLRNPGSLDVISRADFLNFGPLFYGISWQQPDLTWVTFVRKTNPRLLFKPGRRWCQYGDTLKRVSEDPTFVFDDDIDVIVGPSGVIGFSASALKNLFTDLHLAQGEVPRYVLAASATIGGVHTYVGPVRRVPADARQAPTVNCHSSVWSLRSPSRIAGCQRANEGTIQGDCQGRPARSGYHRERSV
jgi:hypothetical protein